MNETQPLPSREELVNHLTRLNEVTLEINELMNQVGGAKTQDEINVLHQSINQKTQQQSEIIEIFMNLSCDNEKVERFKTLVQDITNDAKKLEKLSTNEEITAMQETINNKVNLWSVLLEEIIATVMARLQ